jgi:1-phosphofructokinase
MIYTVTLNPAIDYVVHTKSLAVGQLNRLAQAHIYYGGKGINVSLVLREFGIPSTALGFVAGFTGAEIARGVESKGIKTAFVQLAEGCSRINVKIMAEEETELNGAGPEIDDAALREFYRTLDMVADGDTLVLAGSVPGSMPQDSYEKILEKTADRAVRTVVDTTGEGLLRVLKYRPFLIKPNRRELAALFGKEFLAREELPGYAARLQELGARNVLVSMDADGALLLDENGGVHRCLAAGGQAVNSVGAGDSMIGGFLAGLTKGDYDYALKVGTAAGGATACSDGLCKKNEIERLLGEEI